MAQVVTVNSRPPEGGLVRIAITALGHATGTIAASTWRPGDALDKPPHKTDTYPVYDIRRNAEGTEVTCRANVFGPDPLVTCTLAAASAAAAPSVTITIKGSLGGFADGTRTYPIADAEHADLVGFIAAGGFAVG